MELTDLNKAELTNLDPNDFMRVISIEEFFHILRTLDNLWFYDRDALKVGKVGYHAILKSELCSDGFVNLKVVLKQYPNIRKILAYQLKLMILELVDLGRIKMPTYIAGVPDAATDLGDDVARMLGVKSAEAIKGAKGQILFLTKLAKGETLLLLEDICSKATGITETIVDIITCKNADVNAIIPVEIVLLNRGGLKSFVVKEVEYEIFSAYTRHIEEWMPINASDELFEKFPNVPPCPLCARNVPRIKPKESDDTWNLITTAQI